VTVSDRIVRRGARVLFVDGAGRMLLVRGHDPHQPERTFWFTPGGGLEGDEDSRAAAVRELAEETGFVLEPDELTGPVWRRTAVFDFASQPYVQHEEFYVGRLEDADRRERGIAVLTDTELEAIDEIAWLSRDEVAAEVREVFPDALRAPWDDFLSWNGVTMDLGRVDE
jgi:8-oxo-dGTP pyrophosphatase MutT (NUDIX family)